MSSNFATLLIGLPAVSALIFSVVVAGAKAGEHRLVFRVSGQSVMVLSLTGMLELVSTHEIQLFNPLMNKRKRYMAVRLKDVLDSVYGETWSSSDHIVACVSKRWISKAEKSAPISMHHRASSPIGRNE